jgi:GPH family glycoside/pentoside/hexuronide:cation symporter
LSADTALPNGACARYGLLGWPLAFVAMPLYVVLPQHYGQNLGVPLAWLGVMLLLTRLADALIDPLLGRWADSLLRQTRRSLKVMGVAVVVLGVGFAAAFFPPVRGTLPLLLWCAAALVLTFLAFSLTSVMHLAWGTRLGGGTAQRARLVAWREGFGLMGVFMANVLATQAGLGWTTGVLWAALAIGMWALAKAPAPVEVPVNGHVGAHGVESPPASLMLPWRVEGFRRLLGLFLLNGVSSAIPATLVLFFIQDRLQAMAWAPAFLGVYFLMAALSVPWWVRTAVRLGPMRAWALGMAMSIASFVGVLWLGVGDTWAYMAVCVAGGWALGADLTVPGTLLAGVVQRAGHAQQAEGAYAGWWQWATKLNLALAAGLALPALQGMGYTPGARDAQALSALTLAYGLLPCVFKMCALAGCWRWRRHPALA